MASTQIVRKVRKVLLPNSLGGASDISTCPQGPISDPVCLRSLAPDWEVSRVSPPARLHAELIFAACRGEVPLCWSACHGGTRLTWLDRKDSSPRSAHLRQWCTEKGPRALSLSPCRGMAALVGSIRRRLVFVHAIRGGWLCTKVCTEGAKSGASNCRRAVACTAGRSQSGFFVQPFLGLPRDD